MKKTKIAGICLIVLILAAFVSVPVYNNYCAYNVEKMLYRRYFIVSRYSCQII